MKFLFYIFILFLCSCGDYDNNVGYGNDRTIFSSQDRRATPGTYSVTLTPLNAVFAGTTVGTAIFSVTSETFLASVNISSSPASTVHRQYIQNGSNCPTAAEDFNLDGVVDFIETSIAGEFLIPLDGDLNSQLGGLGIFPSALSDGQYSYSRNSSLPTMLTDIYSTDTDANDNILKLTTGVDLALEGKVLMLYGVLAATVLPTTVQSNEVDPAQTTLPIACGIIVKN